MSKLVKGRDLTPEQIVEVKRAFIYRLTWENRYPDENPCGATVDPITDEEWISKHAFYITKAGKLSNAPGENHCEPVFMAEVTEEK